MLFGVGKRAVSAKLLTFLLTFTRFLFEGEKRKPPKTLCFRWFFWVMTSFMDIASPIFLIIGALVTLAPNFDNSDTDN